MPLGIERINARRRQPNDRIVFIKPLKGPDSAMAQDFLERIAAICNPIMKANHLAVMSLEEYEPNLEFVGRNFNAGEVIQLVLKAPFTGRWLPFRHVQMVMMHELSHCKQMNHSPAFWKVRNQYVSELRQLWDKGYTGEGLWSRGQTLLSGAYATQGAPDSEVIPRSLCGGTYRTSRGRKRKRGRPETAKPTLSYAERQQRRIAKRFGTKGVALGEDELQRVKLEESAKKVKSTAKPRVASSVRGRELRAAAALARFETKPEAKNEESASDSDSGDDDDDIDVEAEDAVDAAGSRILDVRGHGMVRVCAGEGDEVAEESKAAVQRELRELEEVDRAAASIKRERTTPPAPSGGNASQPSQTPAQVDSVKGQRKCPICSLHNPSTKTTSGSPGEDGPPTCIACAHVLDASRVTSPWTCRSDACEGSAYLNAGDCGACGLCGQRR